MNNLVWRQTPDGYQSDGYRIRQLDGWPRARWRLEVSHGRVSWPGDGQPIVSMHSSLRDATRRAARDERQRIRRARVTGHFVIGMGAAVAFVAVSSTTLALSAAGFFWTMGLFYLALGSFSDAIGVWAGYPAKSPYGRSEPDRLTWSARWVLALVEGPRRRYLIAAEFEPAPAVRVLPPRPAG